MKGNIIKAAVTVVIAGVAAYLRQLVGPLIVLAVVMIIDYITGMTEAWVHRTLSSRVGVVGIVKKISYLFAVIVAAVVDYIISTAAVRAGLDFGNFYLFGLLVTIWLILNECISILENLGEIGVPLPGFLKTVTEKLRKTTEKKGEEMAGKTAQAETSTASTGEDPSTPLRSAQNDRPFSPNALKQGEPRLSEVRKDEGDASLRNDAGAATSQPASPAANGIPDGAQQSGSVGERTSHGAGEVCPLPQGEPRLSGVREDDEGSEDV